MRAPAVPAVDAPLVLVAAPLVLVAAPLVLEPGVLLLDADPIVAFASVHCAPADVPVDALGVADPAVPVAPAVA